jgi:hypothetical protein
MADGQASRWQTPTQRRFENFYQVNPKTALAESIRFLAEVLGKEMTRNIAMGYLDTLGTLTQDEAILALSRAQEECKFFPPPATLLEFSGRAVTGDPVAAEAKDELLRILAAMRGPKDRSSSRSSAGCSTAPRTTRKMRTESATVCRFGLYRSHFPSLGGLRLRW